MGNLRACQGTVIHLLLQYTQPMGLRSRVTTPTLASGTILTTITIVTIMDIQAWQDHIIIIIHMDIRLSIVATHRLGITSYKF